MKFIIGYFLSLIGTCYTADLCTSHNIDLVARVVHGEARGESQTGQLAVAYTIVNRVSDSEFPNTLEKVLNQKYTVNGISHYQYDTLGLADHDLAYAKAKKAHNTEYNNAIKAATDALCHHQSDPTKCGAVSYCNHNPCSSTSDNKYHSVSMKIHIGMHWFACFD